MSAGSDGANHGEPVAARRIGDFHLVRLLGRGGMGEVWLARQRSVGRQVALKLLPEVLSDDPRAVLRFRREAEAGGRLAHPAIAAVYAAGVADGRLYIAQELVPGARSLADWIRELPQDRPLDAAHYARVARIVALVARALQYAHEAGVVHRDVKPQNVLLGQDGAPKLVDFGLARIDDAFTVSQSGEVAGTYAYMSPEQARARSAEVDHRSDVFSLGSTLYELLTLARPFHGGSVYELSEQILNQTPAHPTHVRPEVPADLAVACMRALEKRKEDRFQSAAEFADALEHRVRTGDAEPARNPSVPRLRKTKRLVGYAVATGLVLGAATWALKLRPPSPSLITTPNSAGSPYRRLSCYPELARFAREQVKLAEDAMRAPLPGDELRTRLREILVPRASFAAGTSLEAALRSVPQFEAFSIDVAETSRENVLSTAISLAHPIDGESLLDLVAESCVDHVGWSATDQGILVSSGDRRPETVRRTYLVCDLVPVRSPGHGLDVSIDPNADALLDLQQLKSLLVENIPEFTYSDPNVRLDDDKHGALVITHTPEVHRLIHSFLIGLRSCLLLDQCDTEAWDRRDERTRVNERDRTDREALAAKLVRTRIDADFSSFLAGAEAELQRDIVLHLPAPDTDVADWLFKAHDPNPARAVDAYCLAELLAPRWRVVGGVIHVGDCRDGEISTRAFCTRAYAIWDLLANRSKRVDGIWTIGEERENADLVRSNVAPREWEMDARYSLRITNGLLIVHATDRMHAEVAGFLSELRTGR